MRSGIFTQGKRAARWTAAGAAMVMAGVLAGCGSDGDSGGGGATLTAYVYGDDAVKVQQAAVKEFNKTSDVKVKLVSVPGIDYVNKLRSAMGSPSAPTSSSTGAAAPSSRTSTRTSWSTSPRRSRTTPP